MDVNALKQFQAVWQPVLDAIPAAIEATEKKADLERGIAKQKKVLDGVQKEISEAEQRLKDMVKTLEDRVEKDSSVYRDALAAFEQQKAEAAKELEAVRSELDGAKAEAKAMKSAAEKAAAAAAKAKLEVADEKVKELDKQAESLKAEIASLTLQRDQVANAIHALRTQLGA